MLLKHQEIGVFFVPHYIWTMKFFYIHSYIKMKHTPYLSFAARLVAITILMIQAFGSSFI